jgi:hypothetical protein
VDWILVVCDAILLVSGLIIFLVDWILVVCDAILLVGKIIAMFHHEERKTGDVSGRT